MNDNNKKILNTIYAALDEKKAHDIKIIDISKVSSFADYLIVTHGDNINQSHALSDNVEEKLKAIDVRSKSIEGYNKADWILLDYGDYIINIFTGEFRYYYDLERVWQDGRVLDVKEI